MEKLAEIRAKTPNPLGKRVSFRPDECGDNIAAVANNLIFEHGARRHGQAIEAMKKQEHGNGCGCERCKDMVVSEYMDACDEADWDYQSGRWNPEKALVPQEVKKKISKRQARRNRRDKPWNGL